MSQAILFIFARKVFHISNGNELTTYGVKNDRKTKAAISLKVALGSVHTLISYIMTAVSCRRAVFRLQRPGRALRLEQDRNRAPPLGAGRAAPPRRAHSTLSSAEAACDQISDLDRNLSRPSHPVLQLPELS